MANLGTLDRVQRLGAYDIASGIAQNAIKNGTWGDKLAALIGGYIGDRMGEHKYKKDLAKLDAITNAAKNTSVLDADSVVGNTTMTPEEYNQIINGSASGNLSATGSIGEAAQDYSNLLQNNLNDAGPKTKSIGGFNPNYNMDYIEQEARRQGVHSRAWDERKGAIQRDVVQQANAMYLPQIQRNLYGYTDADGNFIAPTVDSRLTAMEQSDALSKYSPETAKAYQALAVGGLQGDVKFQQQKALKEIDARNKIQVANAKNVYRQDNKNQKDLAYYDKEIDTVMKEMASIEKETDKLIAAAQEEGRTYDPTGSTNDSRYTELKNRLARLQAKRAALVGGSTDDETNVVNNNKVDENSKSASNPIDKFFNNKDYNDWNAMLADGETPDESGKIHEKGAFFKLRDYLKESKKNDGTKYTDKEINGILLDLADKLPNWGAGGNYYEYLASKLGVKTKAAQEKDAIDKAIAEQEKKLARDRILFPQKNGIDPFKKIKDFNTGNHDDAFGRALAAAYNNK